MKSYRRWWQVLVPVLALAGTSFGQAPLVVRGQEAGHQHFDYFRPFEPREGSIEGYPFFEMFVADHAFLTRNVRIDFARLENAEHGTVNETEFEFELFWALNNRTAVVVAAPLKYLDPDDEPNTTGFGDLEVGFRFLAFNGGRFLLTPALDISTPTGDPDRDLGEGHCSVEPGLLFLWDLGRGWVAQGDLSFDIPLSVEEPENEFHYDFAISRTLTCTECCCWFRYLTPVVEVNAETLVNGPHSGETVVNLVPGFVWRMGQKTSAGFGVLFPVTGDKHFDSQPRFYLSREF